MNLGNIGVSIMHRIRCIAEGGFKIINGPPKNGKGPMSQRNNLGTRDEASLPQPTQAGRIKPCTELIRQVTKCLENNGKRCVTRLIEELVRADCHNGNVVGKEIADGVRDVVHELWLRSDDELRCKLLRLLVELGVSRNWFRSVFNTNTKMLNKWIARCGIARETRNITRETRNNVVKQLEDLLRRFGWSETWMCEELFKFIGIDVNAFRRHGIEPCSWLEGLGSLRDLRNPYWLGLARSDMTVIKRRYSIELILKTTNSIGAIFFSTLSTVKASSLRIERGKKAPFAKYVSESINLAYYIILSADAWPWPIKLNADELEGILKGFSDEELTEYIAGEIYGDGSVGYDYEDNQVHVEIVACKACPKRINLDVLKEIIARRFGIVGTINYSETASTGALRFHGRNAIKLLRLIRPFVHHPLRRLRIELILALYDGRISREAFEELYKTTEYERGAPDIKRNHALEALAQTAPQTHTHGG